MKVRGKSMIFMANSRAKYSVATQPVAPLTSHQIQVMGATGTSAMKGFSQSRSCELGGHLIEHEFLYIPECSVPCWAEISCQN